MEVESHRGSKLRLAVKGIATSEIAQLVHSFAGPIGAMLQKRRVAFRDRSRQRFGHVHVSSRAVVLRNDAGARRPYIPDGNVSGASSGCASACCSSGCKACV
jgi:hypothetical protein